ncbi:MAG: ATP-binding protein [Actinomycetota bacterium]
MNDDPVLYARSIRLGHAEVRSVRARIRELVVDEGADALLADDIELVASELLTNATEQAAGTDGHVELRRRADHVTITVANRIRGELLPPVAEWTSLTDTAGARGRGLPIIAALSERIETSAADGWTTVTCWWTIDHL